MRYPEDQKEKTRQRIVNEAALRFRRDGVNATGLQPLMKALGLTHGGFYAHFKSKGELVEAALNSAAEQADANIAGALSGDGSLAELIRAYLSSSHRAEPDRGCPLPTMSAELGQMGRPSGTTDALVDKRLAWIAEMLADDNAPDRSVLILAAMVGALGLSRSVTDPELSDRLLKATRRQLLELADGR